MRANGANRLQLVAAAACGALLWLVADSLLGALLGTVSGNGGGSSWASIPYRQGGGTAEGEGGLDVVSSKQYERYAVEQYERQAERRREAVQSLYGGVDGLVPWDNNSTGKGLYYLWDFFPPVFNCPYRERVGKMSDGGKVVCNPTGLSSPDQLPPLSSPLDVPPPEAGTSGHRRPCVIFSFGVRDDISFEEEMAMSTHCMVYAYDPSVPSLPSGGIEAQPCVATTATATSEGDDGSSSIAGGIVGHGACSGRIQFEPVGLSGWDVGEGAGRYRTLGALMAQRNVSHIDILKVDVEGAEWAAFEQMEDAGTLQHVDQLLIELHFKQQHTNVAGEDSGVREVFDLFRRVESAGLFAFSSEANYNAPGTGVGKPFAIEYSFVRPGTRALRSPPRPGWRECRCASGGG